MSYQRARWYVHDRDVNRKIIFIVDRDEGGMTITNDAEEVLNYYHIALGEDWRVVYQDTEGEWWEIVAHYITHGYPNIDIKTISHERWEGHVWDILKHEN